ncbi:cyclic di-GMP phosphodiesterase Gmr [Oxobacter pfennigii]|uniref:Cyclic di-GMP phosphodiesterase Gmr n=1 Tax=Oxobacter pfennigii TaxID=36849 RepID=A0A0P9ABE6_9CLOT|nr:GGDEF domain-containing phosphodiesterase [Oxobacter pfennigii]KPU42382.1 cyclic di-GMP phosphodiesterase Gmr [Oxobacter pfennigii]
MDKRLQRTYQNSIPHLTVKFMPLKAVGLYLLSGIFCVFLIDVVLHKFISDMDTVLILKMVKSLLYLTATSYVLYRIIIYYRKNIGIYVEQLNVFENDLKNLSIQLSAAEDELTVKYNELKNKEEDIRVWKERLDLIIEGTSNTIWEWDITAGKFQFTEKVTNTLGYSYEEFDCISIRDIVHPDDRDALSKDIENHLSGRTMYFQSEFRMKPRIGEYKWVFASGKGIKGDDGKIISMIGSLNDITERKETEEKLVKLVYYDYLTGLQNRALFEERLGSILKEAVISDKRGSVLFIDLDNFKKVNDSLGHDYGDQLIKLAAQMLKLTLGPDDEVCRFGGDEFIILHPQNEGDVTSAQLAKNILDIFVNPFEIGEKQVYVTTSIGIALYPDDGVDVSTILKNADAAMYEAKRSGKNTYSFYNRKVISEIIKRTELEKRMRNAIENDEFYLCYQPQFNIKTGEITSLEALIRWNSPEYGVVVPAEFISIAEESGFIIQIGEWVLKNVCMQSRIWKDKGYNFEHIAINISPIQLKHSGFIQAVNNILEETEVLTSFIEFEITENVLIEPFYQSIEILTKLQDMGIKIALDDFGTGYSSLNYLKMLPINSLKIDKSFIDNITADSDVMSIVEGIITLAHKMKLSVIAEGVETGEQFNILKDEQCDKIQGHYIARPLSPYEIGELLEKQLTICP